MFNVNNKKHINKSHTFFSVSIANFEQLNISWIESSQ